MVWSHSALHRMAGVVINEEVINQYDSNISNSSNYLRKVDILVCVQWYEISFRAIGINRSRKNAKYSKNCDQKFLFLSHQILLYSRSKFYAHQSINKLYVLTLFTILDFPLSKTNFSYQKQNNGTLHDYLPAQCVKFAFRLFQFAICVKQQGLEGVHCTDKPIKCRPIKCFLMQLSHCLRNASLVNPVQQARGMVSTPIKTFH